MTDTPRPLQRFTQELALILRAPYPLVFLRTFEERVALDVLRHIAEPLGTPLLTWSATRGLEDDPDARLEDVLRRLPLLEAPSLIALLQPEPFLRDPLILRHLHDVATDDHAHTLVLIGSQLEIPASLARDVTLLDVPLPDRDTLRALLEEALPADAHGLLPRERLVAAALGLTRDEAWRAFVRARLAHAHAGAPLVFDWEGLVLAEKKRAVSQDDVVEFIEPAISLDDVGGLDELKTWLDTRKAAFSREAREFGLPAPKGLLLVGVQGCGKSLVAKAVARHWGLPLLRFDLGALFGGQRAPDAAMRRALLTAEALAPCVLWTDEIEKGFGADIDAAASRILGTLLTWLQEKESEVFYVATANEVQHLPPELLRKGRFDEMFFVDLPSTAARAQILDIHLRHHGRDPANFDLDTLAELCEHFSGAELETVVSAALYEAFAEARELQTDDLAFIAEETVPLYATREDDIKALREWARTRTRHAARDRRVLDFFGD